MTARTFLLELREAARVELDHVVKFDLGLVADEITAALRALAADPTDANMQALNGHWAHGKRLLNYATKRGGGGPGGGKMTDPALAAEIAEAA